METTPSANPPAFPADVPPQPRRPNARLVFLALVAAAVIAGFFPHDTTTGGELVPAAKRKNMPELALPELNGASWKLSEHRGKVVLVNFWASWCEPCRDETPGLVKVAAEYRDRGLDVTGVAMDD